MPLPTLPVAPTLHASRTVGSALQRRRSTLASPALAGVRRTRSARAPGWRSVVMATTATPFKMSRIGRHGLIYGIGVLLSKAVAFVMLPVYTRYLTPADYGLLQLIDMVLEVASIVAGSRLGAGIFRYYHKAETPEDRRAVLSTAAIVLVTTYALAATLLCVFAPTIAQVALGGARDVALVRIAGMSLGLQSLLIVPFAYLRVRDRSVFYVAITLVKLVLQVGLNIAFVVY